MVFDKAHKHHCALFLIPAITIKNVFLRILLDSNIIVFHSVSRQ